MIQKVFELQEWKQTFFFGRNINMKFNFVDFLEYWRLAKKNL